MKERLLYGDGSGGERTRMDERAEQILSEILKEEKAAHPGELTLEEAQREQQEIMSRLEQSLHTFSSIETEELMQLLREVIGPEET